jgi:cytidyltransferase-like protein
MKLQTFQALSGDDDMPTVCVSGGFDPLHVGHLRMFKEAAEYGDLIVIINSDEWLIRKKGKLFMLFEERAEIIASLDFVYKVVLAKDSDGTVCDSLKELEPDYFANGGDRGEENTPELDVCEELGIEPLFNIGGGKVRSSSDMLRQYNEIGEENVG